MTKEPSSHVSRRIILQQTLREESAAFYPSALDVFIADNLVGRLTATPEGCAAFQYSSEWISEGFSISPFSLPLENRLFIAKPSPLKGLFGVFNDSLPDGWGMLLLDRTLRAHGINPDEIDFLTRLAIVGQSGAGALEYRPAINQDKAEENKNLDFLAQSCAQVLDSHNSQNRETLDTLFAMGGSSGGARPKVYYEIDGEEWIVKFPSLVDDSNIGEKEYELSIAAKECGIEMPETLLLPSQICSGYFATKRFDRVTNAEGETTKIHMVSAAGLLETTHRIPNLEYELLMKMALKLSGSMGEVERVFKLMVFNVLSGNRDDHSRNFTFIYTRTDGWQLSPAYDITSCSGMRGEHATTVCGKGRNITTEDMMSAGAKEGLSIRQMKQIIEQTHDVLNAHGQLD